MTIRLRPHHLLCMLTFVGEGYSSAFIANYWRIVRRFADGETIEIVEGPDDICAPLLVSGGGAQDVHCHGKSVCRRDEKAASAVAALLGRPVAVGEAILPEADLLTRLRLAFRQGTIREACLGCEWSGLCDSVAAADFAGAPVGA